jgi:hypothetical protein
MAIGLRHGSKVVSALMCIENVIETHFSMLEHMRIFWRKDCRNITKIDMPPSTRVVSTLVSLI